MRKQWLLGVVLAAAMGAGLGSAEAASVNLSSVTGTWTSVDPATAVGLNGVNTNEIKWGTAATSFGQSGYRFEGAAATSVESGQEFDLGVFTHINRTINAGTSIKGATLKVAIDILIGTTTETIDVVFDFTHLETVNSTRRRQKCADGGKNKVGVNRNGCADRVTVGRNVGSANKFVIDGMTYILDVTGLLYNGNTLNDFWTTENLENSAFLRAKLTVLGDPPPPPPSTVPLPAGGSLLLLGLGGLAAFARRRRAA